MRKILAVISFTLLLVSCKPEGNWNYGQGFKSVWGQKEINYNASSIIEDKGFIYGLTLDDKLFKIELNTGKIIWTRPALPNYASQKPLIIDDNIFIGGRDSLFAYDLNGNLKWKQVTGQKIGHTLLAYDSLLIGSVRSKGLYAFEQSTGKPSWSIEPPYQMLSSSDPILIDSLLIVGDFDYKENIGTSLYCINANSRMIHWSYPTSKYLTSEAEVKANTIFINLDSSYANGYTQGLNLKNGELRWSTKTYPDIHYKPFLIKDKLFISSYRYGLLCLNPETGKVIWTLNLNKEYPDTKIILHKEKIIFGTNGRTLYKVSLTGKILNKIAFEYGLGDPFIYENTLFVNTGGGEMYKEIKNVP
jgi:outer membrane protein assembly factor BamB